MPNLKKIILYYMSGSAFVPAAQKGKSYPICFLPLLYFSFIYIFYEKLSKVIWKHFSYKYDMLHIFMFYFPFHQRTWDVLIWCYLKINHGIVCHEHRTMCFLRCWVVSSLLFHWSLERRWYIQRVYCRGQSW